MKKTLFSSAGLLLVAAAILLSTWASDALFTGVRVDLTENKLYTLSDGTRNILQSNEENITLKFFYSRGLTEEAPSLRSYAAQIRELLEEIELAAKGAPGNLMVVDIDPEPFSEEEDAATEYGLQGIPLGNAQENVYLGMVGVNEKGGEEVIAFLHPDREQYLEFDVIQMIDRLRHGEKPVVGVITKLPIAGGFDMMTRQATQPWLVMSQLDEAFELQYLDPDTDTIDEKVRLLLVIHPKALSDATLYAIDQFALSGRNLMVFIDPMAQLDQPTDPMAADAMSASSNLPGLLEAWGVDYADDQILGDAQHALRIGMPGSFQPVLHVGLYGFNRDNIDAEDRVTKNLESLNFATAGVLSHAEGATTEWQALVQSSVRSTLFDIEDLEDLQDPEELLEDFQATGEQYTVAARVRGAATTAFADGLASDQPLDEHLEAGQINVLLVADTDVLSDRMWVQVQSFLNQRVAQPFADNGSFMINSVENMLGSTDLINVRSRGRYSRPFTRVEDLQRKAEEQYRSTERALMSRLAATEQQLASLQEQKLGEGGDVMALSPEQEKAIESFLEEKLSIRKELREVQHRLDKDIDALGNKLKLLNIILVPVLLTVLALLHLAWRRRIQRGC